MAWFLILSRGGTSIATPHVTQCDVLHHCTSLIMHKLPNPMSPIDDIACDNGPMARNGHEGTIPRGGWAFTTHAKNTISVKVMNGHANPISGGACYRCAIIHTNLEGKKPTSARPPTPRIQKLAQKYQIRAKLLSNQGATPHQIHHHNTPCQHHYCQCHKKSQCQC